MKRLAFLVVATFAIAATSIVQAQYVGPAPDGCYKDLAGKISCPPLGGEIYVDLSGQAVCGKGRCVRDPFGKVTCSSVPGGQVVQDVGGKVTCAGTCELASASYCQELK